MTMAVSSAKCRIASVSPAWVMPIATARQLGQEEQILLHVEIEIDPARAFPPRAPDEGVIVETCQLSRQSPNESQRLGGAGSWGGVEHDDIRYDGERTRSAEGGQGEEGVVVSPAGRVRGAGRAAPRRASALQRAERSRGGSEHRSSRRRPRRCRPRHGLRPRFLRARAPSRQAARTGLRPIDTSARLHIRSSPERSSASESRHASGPAMSASRPDSKRSSTGLPSRSGPRKSSEPSTTTVPSPEPSTGLAPTSTSGGAA